MNNPDYHPDTAHLPNEEDLRRWRNGGRAKHLAEEAKLERRRQHHAVVLVRQAELLGDTAKP
jgi:hypothetical protein